MKKVFIKKAICVLLGVLMVFSVASCKGKEGLNQASGQSESDSSLSSGFQSNSSSEVKVSGSSIASSGKVSESSTTKKMDLKGKTIKIQSWAGYLSGEIQDNLTVKAAAMKKDIEKAYNCKIQYVSPTAEQVKVSVQAGKPVVDVWWMANIDLFLSSYSSGQLINLSDTKTFNGDNRTNFTKESEIGKINGSYFGVQPVTYGAVPFFTCSLLLANLDSLNSVGVSENDLSTWQKNGTWTWDKFEEVCAKVKNKTNKPLIGDTDGKFYQILLNANNADWVTNQNNGLVFTGDEQKAVRVLNKYTDWVTKGYITTQQGLDFVTGQSTFSSSIMWVPLYTQPKVNFSWMLPPKGPDSNVNSVSISYASFIGIPKGSKPSGATDSEIAFIMERVCDRICTVEESNAKIIPQLSVGIKNNLSKETALAVANFGTWPFTFSAATSGIKIDVGDDGWYTQVIKIANGETTLAQAINSYKVKYNSLLKNIYKVR